MNFETAKYEHSLPAKRFFRTAVFGGGSISGAGVQIAPTSSPPRAVLIDIVRPLAVCVAPAANREQTQIASGLTSILVFELYVSTYVSEMQPNNDENLPKLGSSPLNWPVRFNPGSQVLLWWVRAVAAALYR